MTRLDKNLILLIIIYFLSLFNLLQPSDYDHMIKTKIPLINKY